MDHVRQLGKKKLLVGKDQFIFKVERLTIKKESEVYMWSLVQLYFRRAGFRTLVLYLSALFLAATFITSIIFSGLWRDNKLSSILPAQLNKTSPAIQASMVFYYFETLFMRAGIILLEGFLSYQIIARAFEDRTIAQLLTYPISRTKVYLGMLFAIFLISGLVLLILHLLVIMIFYLMLKNFRLLNLDTFLFKDLVLDLGFILAGLLSGVVAMFKNKVGYIIGNAIFLCVILGNATVSTSKNQNNNYLFWALLIIALITLSGSFLALKKFNHLNI